MVETSELIIESDATLKEALNVLNNTAQGILLLIDQHGRLIQTVTDGDVRRLLLNGYAIESKLEELPYKQPITLPLDVAHQEVIQVMNDHNIDHIPLIDEKGVPKKLIHRRDISSAILLSTPHIGEFEMEFINQAFATNWVAPLGPNVDCFEKEFAEFINIKAAAAVSSGTAALHLAVRLLNIKRDDVVFCSSLTFVASVNPVIYEGATPVFIDSEPESWNMSPLALTSAFLKAERTGRLPKAVIVVNLYGQSADFDPILEICNHYGVPVIEDAAESLGANYKGRASGTLGKIGIFSFNGNKIITTSGGGMLVSDDARLVERARFLSTQARDKAPYYKHTEIGYNYRLSNVLAGIGRGQLKILEQRVAARRAVFQNYQESLKDIPAIQWMPEASFGQSTRWLSALYINSKLSSITPSDIIESLRQANIEARRIWKPMHQQPIFQGCEYFPHEENKSTSDLIFQQGVCLPSGSNLSPQHQSQVIDKLRSCMKSSNSINNKEALII